MTPATALVKRRDAAPVTGSLDELTQTVIREHEASMSAIKATIEHAVRAGEALLAVREQTLPTNEWTPWLRKHFPKSRTQVYAYMRIATHKDAIPDGYGVAAANRLIKGLRALDGVDRRRVEDAAKDDAARWRREGVAYKEIAKRLEVSPATVHNWFNGTKVGREKKARQALKRQEKQRATKQAVAKAGEALKEAYAMAERLDDVLGQAHREATESSARRDLARAHEFQRALRDSIVSALGVE